MTVLPPCPDHKSGQHYFIYMRVPGWFCIDCGLIDNSPRPLIPHTPTRG